MMRLASRVFKIVAAALVLSLVAIGFAVVAPLKEPPLSGAAGTYVVRNINIVDVESGELIENSTVIFDSKGILSIQTNQLESVPTNATVIDGENLYLMPGLWDMHTHSLKLSPQLHHPLFLRHGITSIRDMSGCLDRDDSYWACPVDRQRWEEASLKQNGISPRYHQQSSYQANGGNEVPLNFPDYFRLDTLEDARQASAFFLSQGADFIKTYSELSQEQFENLSLAVAERGLSLAGHKPLKVPLVDAIEAQMSSIEHGRLFMFECYQLIDSFRAEENPLTIYNSNTIRDIMELQDTERCSELMELMAESETYWVPTLTTLKMSAMSRQAAYRTDSRLVEIPLIVKALVWNPDIDRAAESGFDEDGKFVHGDYFEMVSRQVASAKAHGVKILAGTDNIDTYVFTGSSLHDELSMLVEAGLTPLQALQSATIDAAKYSGKGHELGSIQVGKKADMILLTENPLDDVRNTRSITGVIFNGIYFDESALLGLQQYSIEMARSWRINLRYLANLIMSPLMRVQLAD
tara:strand:+ start:187 stop:1752 length:1566 start_codon:yes stop_codon:yes gene_type:complete